MKDYFDISVKLNNNNLPEMQIVLKSEFKKKKAAFRESGKSYSGVQLEYYLHHLIDPVLAKEVWEFRKNLCSKKNQFDFLYSNGLIDEKTMDLAQEWLLSIDSKQKKNHQNKMSQPDIRKKISDSSKKNSDKSSERLKNLWKTNRKELHEALFNPEVSQRRKENFKKHFSDPENRKKFQDAMRNPDRKRKISEAAKEMWKNADSKKIAKMRSQWSKKFFFHGKKMNAVELKVAMFLESNQIPWEYEPVIKTENGFIQPDFVINGNTVIECFGDFWHANPNLYQDEEILFSTRTAKEQRNIDDKRIQFLKNCYSNVIILWESEIKSSSFESKIKEIIDGMG